MSIELFTAIEEHDLNRIAKLLSEGADPNADHPNQPSWVPLKAAAEEVGEGSPIDAVVLLLRHGADVDGGRVPGNATPLIVAALNKQSEVARLLLAAGADPKTRDIEGDTPLGLCLRKGDSQTAELLRLCGASDEI